MATTKTVKKVATKKAPSSVIQSMSYEEKGGVLTVTFTTGKVYRYYKVERARARAVELADSQGSAFYQLIRGKYPFEQVKEESVA